MERVTTFWNIWNLWNISDIFPKYFDFNHQNPRSNLHEIMDWRKLFLETFLESRFGGGESSFWDSHFGDNFRACIYSEKTFKFSEVLGWKLMSFIYRRQVNFNILKEKTVNRMQLMLTLYCTYRCMCLLLKRVNKTESTLKHTWPYYCLQPKLLVDELSQAQLSSPCLGLGSSIRHPSFRNVQSWEKG